MISMYMPMNKMEIKEDIVEKEKLDVTTYNEIEVKNEMNPFHQEIKLEE